MFLSMLVAWMIPDVPRSLREQLKKENMMLMEFLLNHDQEARLKSHSPARSIPCIPAHIDIVVEEPPEELTEPLGEEEEEAEAEQLEITLDEPTRRNDSDPEIGRSFEDAKENVLEEQRVEAEDEGRPVEGGETNKDGEVNETEGRGDKEQGGEEKEEEAQILEAQIQEESQIQEEAQIQEEIQIQEGAQIEEEAQKEEKEENKLLADENFTVDLDSFMSDMGLLGEIFKQVTAFFVASLLNFVTNLSNSFHIDDEPSPGSVTATGLPRSDSKQDDRKDRAPPSLPSSKRGSSQSLKSPRADITAADIDSRLFSLIAPPPPPREPGLRAKARCSTLPSRHKGAEACYSLPRPSHSTSLTRFQQAASFAPLLPLGSSPVASSNPLSGPHTPVSPSPPAPSPAPSPSAPQPSAPTELFALKGPPPQQPRSRGKARCSTLPPRQRPPGPEEPTTKPSHSTSFTKLGGRIPPSPSELKRNTPV